jgi:putative transposase
MAKAYPKELRQRAIKLYEEGNYSLRSLAKAVDLGVATLTRWISRYRKTGDLEAKARGGNHPSKIDASGQEQLKALLKSESDLTLLELTNRYNARADVKVAPSSVSRALTRAGITRKKRRGMRPSKAVTVSRD